ncbi:MAG: hypothetical protein K5739_06730, partial [Lachnospiraceae bacterium]|nr:hypothetical protein [Lachnospiraceae bacterium]
QYEKTCRQYNELYSRLVDFDENVLLIHYSEDVVQEYVKNAITNEGDAKVLEKLTCEKEFFTGVLGRIRELLDYIQELFPEI